MAGLLERLFPPKPVPLSPPRILRGTVERVSVFVADEYYMGITLLLKDETQVYRLKVQMYDQARPPELTQPDDVVTFIANEAGHIDADSFRNFTLETKLNSVT
jgi:hypothetical protein